MSQRGRSVRDYVYILEECKGDKPTGYYKIGKTRNLEKRISDLQTGNPRKLRHKKSKAVTDSTATESKLLKHPDLSEYKAQHEGGREWFKVKEEDLESFYNTFDEIVNADADEDD